MIKWLFFDIGSTLIDETDCVEFRIDQLLRQPNAPSREVVTAKMKEIASIGGNAYKEAATYFGLQITPWPAHLEKLYPQTVQILTSLQKKYRLGLIANQNPGLESRLRDFGIAHLFEVTASSAEVGIAKPDFRIFLWALEQANCRPEEAMMIGDRLDNDIVPAAKLGMKTLWVTQGSFRCDNLSLYDAKPDYAVDRLKDIVKILP